MTRGIELKPFDEGSATAAATGESASQRPTASPATVPITKAMTVS